MEIYMIALTADGNSKKIVLSLAEELERNNIKIAFLASKNKNGIHHIHITFLGQPSRPNREDKEKIFSIIKKCAEKADGKLTIGAISFDAESSLDEFSELDGILKKVPIRPSIFPTLPTDCDKIAKLYRNQINFDGQLNGKKLEALASIVAECLP